MPCVVWSHNMRKVIYFILVAIAVAIIYLGLSGGLWEDKDKKRKKKVGSGTRVVRETVESGRAVGRGSSNAFESVEFGREK